MCVKRFVRCISKSMHKIRVRLSFQHTKHHHRFTFSTLFLFAIVRWIHATHFLFSFSSFIFVLISLLSSAKYHFKVIKFQKTHCGLIYRMQKQLARSLTHSFRPSSAYRFTFTFTLAHKMRLSVYKAKSFTRKYCVRDRTE